MNTSVQSEKSRAAIMNIRIAFADNYPENGDIIIEKLRNAMNTVVPAVTRNGGILTLITEESITAVFENSTEAALQASLDIFADASIVMSEEMLSSLSVGIHEGMVFLSVLSYQDTSIPIAVSEDVNVARRLSKSAARYDARILMTNTALSCIRAYDTRFNCRKLGVIYSKHSDREEVIYDMFDSDPTNLKYRKKRSRLVFENGVNNYISGEYLQARNCFIELLKYDRSDRTAKEYVFMCDKALSGQIEPLMNKYLELW